MILDTTVLIDLMNGRKEAVDRITALLKSGTPTTITAPSIFELFSGLAQSSKPAAEKEKIHQVLHRQPRWNLDDASAENAGRIHGLLVKNNQKIEAIDSLIAGIALQHNEPVLTRNVKHFSRVPGLKVETY